MVELCANNRLFNEDALKNRAELEPIDHPTRSTTPHQYQGIAVLGIVLVGIAAWLVLGSVDHSLWLHAERFDAESTSTRGPDDTIRLRTTVSKMEGRHLRTGLTAFVFQDDVTGAFVEGSIDRIATKAAGTDQLDRTTILQIDISPTFSPHAISRDSDPNYRLRVPVGSQSPIQMIIGFVNKRPAQATNR